MRFFEYPITGDRSEHAQRKVGPATDYACPMRTIIDAPFAGHLTPYWTREGGNSLKLDGDRFIFHAQHLFAQPVSGAKAWRGAIASSGNTGSATTGPHVHCYIIVKATGQRISFTEWLRDYVNTPTPAPAPPPAPAPAGIMGRRLFLAQNWYWYRNASDARVTRSPQGKGRGQSMVQGEYFVLDTDGGAILIGSKANGRVWLHPSAAACLT